jgi:anti-sigma regulatory factor (Ser/Thr protein kinase)
MVQQLINLESFVTLCYMRIDRNKGYLDLVDCGHTGLIHCRAASGTCEIVHGSNLPLGVRREEVYEQLRVPIEPGDRLLLFSDGITESRNPAGELFGKDRLVQCLKSNRELEPGELVKAIRAAAFAFSGSTTPSDDLTCVAIAVLNKQLVLEHREMDIRSDLGELSSAREFVRSACRNGAAWKLDEGSLTKLELAVTEACSNIIKHAHHGRPNQSIHLEAELFADRISVLLQYSGEPFDPTTVPTPQLDGSQNSGFGVYLIDRSVDEVHYYLDERGRNCISLVKNFGAKEDERNGPDC